MANHLPLKNFLKTGSPLICIEKKHTIDPQTYVIVMIDGKQYHIVCGVSSGYLLVEDILRQFRIGVPSVVELRTNSGDTINSLITFHDIPTIPPQITFSVYRFEKGKFMDVRFAQKSDKNSPNFALGGLDVYSFIQEFRRASSHEHSIPVLWKMLIDALRNIGYFDIQNHNDFQTTVFLLFQRMLSFQQHSPNLRELFYSFVQRILAKNAWFLIVDQSIQSIRPPSRELIELFSDAENPPIVNFINHDSNIIGLTKNRRVGMGYLECSYALVSLSTTEVRIVHDDSYAQEFVDDSQHSTDILAWIFDYHYGPPLRRTCYVDTSAIPHGFSNIGPLQLVVFKTEKSIDVFRKRPDGTFEPFSIPLFIMSEIFAVGNKFSQLTNYFASRISVEDLVEGLVKCGFKLIFDGTATREQFSHFLFKSDFGCVLQKLRCEIDGFPKRLIEQYLLQYQEELRKKEIETPTPVKDLFEARLHSIRKNDFIVDFNKIFVFLLEKLGNRDDLSPEIRNIVLFLEQLVKFLNTD